MSGPSFIAYHTAPWRAASFAKMASILVEDSFASHHLQLLVLAIVNDIATHEPLGVHRYSYGARGMVS